MDQHFTQQEWEACIKVLKALSRVPELSPDNDTLKGLVTKLYKRAKKERKLEMREMTAEQPVANTQLLPLRKIQQIARRQAAIRQYNNTVLAQTALHRNYEQPADKHMAEAEAALLQLAGLQKCYTCGSSYKDVHFFYHLLCPTCAALNFDKRQQRCDLQDRIALVTGGRIKIGYLTALKLLRDGAKVWVTTRFANDCAMRFAQEPDAARWLHRLRIVPVDFRNPGQLQHFIHQLQEQEPYLDIIINNAAQTVRRPAAFYRHLFDAEQLPVNALPAPVRDCMVHDAVLCFKPAAWEQKLLPGDMEQFFPKHAYDKDRQQIDLRPENSWTQLLQDISPMEMLETQLVNVTAPFMLNSQLKPMLLRSPYERKFIVNVSAMEGQFNRDSKTPYHPHTNMAKAALNMMTRTSAQEYAQQNIFMNSVDTGWITQENPHPKKEKVHASGFVPPLDETDGMARIYDPVATGINSPELPLFGHFLKNYLPHAW